MTDAAERSNLPACIDAATIAQLYRKRWRIEGLSGRLESVCCKARSGAWATRARYCWGLLWQCWRCSSTAWSRRTASEPPI